MKALFAVLAFAFVLVGMPRLARAQQVELSANVDPQTVEVGATFRYQMRAQVTGTGGASPRSAQPGALPAGIDLVSTSSSPMRIAVNMNGVPSQIEALTTVWTLRASKTGTFTLGPATVDVSGTRRTAKPVKVTVVAKGKAPRPQRGPDAFDPFSGNPFDFFNQGPDPFGGGGLPFDPFRDLQDDQNPLFQIPTDKKFALAEPRAPKAFLHAVVDKPRAVVGEQVTLSVYLYSLPDAQLGSAQDVHVPSAPDFTRQPLFENARVKNMGRAQVGDRAWDVELILKDALFPVKTGKLTIGPLSLVLTNNRIGYRESETLSVDVTEPPLAGRPPGYAVGDVGDFSLSASVTPRKAQRGEPIGVQLELRGTGNLPTQLPLPTSPGIEWMDAQTKDAIGAQREDRVGGTRTFTYVVRVDKEGAVDLGEVKLPYYDAERRAYGVARASLGIVDVAKGPPRPDAGVANGKDDDGPALELPKPRTTLEGAHETSWLVERRGYWASVLGAPLACLAAVLASRGVGRIRERRKARTPDPARVAKERRAEADAAMAGDDGGAAVSAVARALEAGVLARTGFNVRGAAGDALVRELEQAGAPPEAAKKISDALRACEDARFSPAGVSMQDARDLWTKAQAALDALGPA